jgi:hypothetical protein
VMSTKAKPLRPSVALRVRGVRGLEDGLAGVPLGVMGWALAQKLQDDRDRS